MQEGTLLPLSSHVCGPAGFPRVPSECATSFKGAACFLSCFVRPFRGSPSSLLCCCMTVMGNGNGVTSSLPPSHCYRVECVRHDMTKESPVRNTETGQKTHFCLSIPDKLPDEISTNVLTSWDFPTGMIGLWQFLQAFMADKLMKELSFGCCSVLQSVYSEMAMTAWWAGLAVTAPPCHRASELV